VRTAEGWTYQRGGVPKGTATYARVVPRRRGTMGLQPTAVESGGGAHMPTMRVDDTRPPVDRFGAVSHHRLVSRSAHQLFEPYCK
jgi:hypothetical protein